MQQTTSKASLTGIRMIYMSILVVLVLFAGVVIFLKSKGAIPADPDANPEMFKYLVYVLTPVGVVASFLIYRKKLKEIETSDSLGNKLIKLQSFILIRAACMEAPALLATVGAFQTGDISFLAFTGLIIALMLYFRPTADSIANDLQLSEVERSELVSPEAVIK